MTTHRALIVDDEHLGRERIRQFLAGVEDFEEIGQCADGEEAVAAIERDAPDVVFLDIQMPRLDGFGVLRALKDKGVAFPEIIFVTAFDQHAVQAFEVHALDYLLKPVQRDRFEQALERVRQRSGQGGGALPDKLARWLAEQAEPARYLSRLEVRNHDRWEYVPVGEIAWLEADGNYVEVHTAERAYLIRATLSNLEAQLDPEHFLRIGRSTLVNLSAVTTIKRTGRSDYAAILANGHTLPISRGITELQQRMQFS